MPFEIPEGWSWCTLDELTTSIGDGLHGTPKFDDNGEYYFVNGNNLDGIISIKKETKRTTIDEYTKQGLKFNSQTIFVSINGTLGNIAFYNNELIVLGKSACYINLLDGISKEYIATILRCQYFLNYCRDTATGSTIKNVPLAAMRSLFIPIPSYQEQLRIVDEVEKLLSLVDLLDENTNELGNAITVAKSTILDLAIHGKLVPQDPNDEPAIELLKRINPKFTPCDNAHYPFDVPNNWIWAKGLDIFKPMKTTSPSGDTFKYIDIDAVDNKRNVITSVKLLNTKQAPSRASRYTEKGCVLFSMVRPYLRNIAMVTEDDCIASTGFFVCHGEVCLFPKFSYFQMLSNYVVDGLNDFMKGDNSPSITKAQIEDFLFPLPPLNEQKRIVSKIEELFAVLDEIQKSIEV